MSSKLTIILVLMLAILTGLSYWDEYHSASEMHQDEQLVFAMDGVTTIEHHLNGQVFKMRYGDHSDSADWFGPQSILLQKRAVLHHISALRSYRWKKQIHPDTSADQIFGLIRSCEHACIRINDDNGKSMALYLGNDTAIGYDLYFAMSNDQRVFIGSRILRLLVSKKLSDFRSRVVLPRFDSTKISWMKLQRASNEVVEWKQRSDSNLDTEVQQDRIVRLFGALKNLTAIEFQDRTEPFMSRLNAPLYQISWNTLNNVDVEKKMSVYFYNEKIWVSHSDSQTLFEVAPHLLLDIGQVFLSEDTVVEESSGPSFGLFHQEDVKRAKSSTLRPDHL